MSLPWHQYIFATIFILAGLNHFRVPRLYAKIIPSYLPYPNALNLLAGFFEVVFGIMLLIPALSNYAAMGIMALLVAVFPSNIFMYTDKKASLGLSKNLLLLRLPLQILLIIWAYFYTGFIK